MKKKIVKKQKVQTNRFDFEKELITLGHLIKYNLYLVSKAIVFDAVLQKEGDINKAANFTHAIMMAFHDQDHREVPEKAGDSDTEKKV